jgi:hypothetical protein
MSCRKDLCVYVIAPMIGKTCTYVHAPYSKYCVDHQCGAGTCKSGKSGSGRLCSKHQAPRRFRGPYHCSVKDCFNPKVVLLDDVPYCPVHWCGICGIPIYECNKHEYTRIIYPELDGWVTTCATPNCNNPRYYNGFDRAYFLTCRSCLIQCDAAHCHKHHIKGTKFCQTHACVCHGGDHWKPSCSHNSAVIAHAKNFWWCQSLNCKVCPFSDRFLLLYCMAGLGCDTPIMEALFCTLHNNEIRTRARNSQ